MTAIAPRSSTIASVSNVRLMPLGTRGPASRSTPTANAMSVAMGIPQPLPTSVPAVIAR